MKISNTKTLLGFLLCLCIILCNTNTASAKDRHKDIFTNVNKVEKYRYYSSPEGSAYIDQLPEGYIHISTKITKEINPKDMTVGDVVEFQTTEPVVLSDFLTLPENSVISGRVTQVSYPKKLIKNSKIRIDFNKVTTPNGYVFELNDNTFKVMYFEARKGSRYSFLNEGFYGDVLAGAKYPISRFLNTPLSVAIGAGAGLIGGAAYGALIDEVPENMGQGIMRGIGCKAVYNILFQSNKNFILRPGDDFILTVYNGSVKKLKYQPEYLNIQQLILASSLSDDKNIDKQLISKTTSSNTNASKVINYYEKSVNNNENNIDAQINLGKSYLSSGRVQTAIQYFNELASSNINNAEVFYHLAQAQEEAGQLTEAKTNYSKAIENNLKNKEVYLKMANLLNKMGQSAEAAEYFDKYNQLTLASTI